MGRGKRVRPVSSEEKGTAVVIVMVLDGSKEVSSGDEEWKP